MSSYRFASASSWDRFWGPQPTESPTQPRALAGTSSGATTDPGHSRWLAAYAERVLALRRDPERVKLMFDRCSVPMLMVDGDRNHVHANVPARLAIRQSLAELRLLRLDDLTPADLRPAMREAWSRLRAAGLVTGTYDVASPTGTSMRVVFYAAADALPGLSLIAFAPAGWTEHELVGDTERATAERTPRLTRRELEVLRMAAEGLSSPMIADELVLSVATVKTHFANIYSKLGVRDRAAAVAKAIRFGLID